MKLDLDFVRRQYPIFSIADRRDWAFFENAGGSYVPRQVIDRLNEFFRCYKVQPYGPFNLSTEAGNAMDAGYQFVAQLLDTDVDNVTLGPSTTMNGYVLAHALRPALKAGDEIVVTNQDHEANIGCWERLREFGVNVKQWSIDGTTGELDLNRLAELLTSRTRAVCFTLCSNIVGSINDGHAITALAHQHGALAIADGVSYAPHIIPDLPTLDVDVYLFSTYKTFGTHVGVMWIRPESAERFAPQGHYFNANTPHYRMNPAGPQHAEIAALAGVGDYLHTLFAQSFDAPDQSKHAQMQQMFRVFGDHETELANRLLDALRQLPQVRVIGQPTAQAGRRAPTISFVTERMRSGELARRLAEKRIAVRNGHFYALRCIEALGLEDPDDGVLRVSLVHYNTAAEVDRLVTCLQRWL